MVAVSSNNVSVKNKICAALICENILGVYEGKVSTECSPKKGVL